MRALIGRCRAPDKALPASSPPQVDQHGRQQRRLECRRHGADSPAQWQAMAQLERVAGLDRWTIARQFPAAFGKSPTPFRTMRQLDLVRQSLHGRMSPVEAAVAAGFADQSPMSRQFKAA